MADIDAFSLAGRERLGRRKVRIRLRLVFVGGQGLTLSESACFDFELNRRS
jgi:hypothetical protein